MKNQVIIDCNILACILQMNLQDRRNMVKLHKSVVNIVKKTKKTFTKSGNWHLYSIWYNLIVLWCMRRSLPLLVSTSSTRPLPSFVKSSVHNPFDYYRRLLQSAGRLTGVNHGFTCATERLALRGFVFTGKSRWCRVLFLGVSSLSILNYRTKRLWF